MQEQAEFPLRRYLSFLQRQGWLILLSTAVSLVAAAAVTFSQDKVYRATMKLVVIQSGGEREPQFGSEELSQTMATLLESDTVAQEVIRNQRLDATTKDVLKDLDVTFRPSSAVLNVSYDSKSGQVALGMLKEFANVFQGQVERKLGVQSGGGALGRPSPLPVITVDDFDPPHVLSEPVKPKPAKNLAFAGVLGLAIGILLGIARDTLDDRLRESEQAEEWFGAPVVGTLPKGARGKPPPGIAGGAPGQEGIVDALQLLRARVEFSQSGLNGPTILVTSAVTDEGKTTVAANLSAALAAGGKKVVCIDADMRRPRLHSYLGLDSPQPGLLSVLRGGADLEEALYPVELADPRLDGASAAIGKDLAGWDASKVSDSHLFVLPTGGVAPDPGALLTDSAVGNLVKQLRPNVDYIIIDSPPLLGLPESLPLALNADNVLVVARRGRTRKGSAEAVRASLLGLGVRNVGVVITDVPRYDGYGYGYRN
jgi:polysaccharide biosynthesis transport protein